MSKMNSYTGIDVKKELEGLRERRSMYLGSTFILVPGRSPAALIQLSQEILSNSLDEVLEGYGKSIDVVVYENQAMSVQDKGRGIPKGPDKSFDDVINATTIPHASGKFGSNGYQTTGIAGMNGIGVKATNATSKYFKVKAISHSTTINRKGEKMLDGGVESYSITLNMSNVIDSEIHFRYAKNEINWLDNNTFEVIKTGEKFNTGTYIEFLPDDGPVSDENSQKVFESVEWSNDDLFERFESSAFLNQGVIINYEDRRQIIKDEESDEESYLKKSWQFNNGLVDYVTTLAEGQNLLSGIKDPIIINKDYQDGEHHFKLNAALLFTDDISTNIVTFANSVPTKSGGPHLDGFNSGLTKAVNDYAKDKKIKTQGLINQSDILEGLVAVFELKIPAAIAEFSGQTKEILSTSQAKHVTHNIVYDEISNWLHDNQSKSDKIVKKILESKQAREAAIKSRQEAKKARESKGADKLEISSKLKGATSKNPAEKELFITEGDSASNIRRDQKTQAIFPIRGKFLNTQEMNLSDILKNQEASTITGVIGSGIGPAFELDEMNYHKIVLACFKGDTKIKSLDGNSYTFKELVDNNVKELWVYSMDKYGNVVPALAKNIRKTGSNKQLIKLTLDNGEEITSTRDHYFMTLDGNYKKAEDLELNESLMPVHTKINDGGYEEYYDKNTNSWVKTHRMVNENINNKEREEAYERLQLEDNLHRTQHNNIQTHHIDENKLNNHPDNLTWLTNREHFTLHGKSGNHFRKYNSSEEKREYLKELHSDGHYDHTYFGNNGYNGSEKHVNRVKELHEQGHYDHTYFGNNGYNGSEKNRETARRVNKSEKHIKSVARGKVLVSIKFLQLNNLPFDEYHYNFYRNCAACKYDTILRYFDSYDEAFELAKDYEYREYQQANEYSYEYDNNKKQKTQIARVIKKLLDENIEFNKENYNEHKGKRTINYDNIINWFNSYDDAIEYAKNINHKIINIELIDLDEEEDVYCLTVPEYHNFLLHAGIIVKNCDADSDGHHIAALLIAFFYRFFRPMVEEGRLYLVQAPLYKAVKYVKGEKQIKVFYSQSEIDSYKGDLSGWTIQRYKGLGEMNPDEVYDAITNKETRHLIQIKIDDAEKASKMLNILMGSNADLRKEWIETSIDFDKINEEGLV